MLALATILDSQGLQYDAAVLQDGAGELQYFTALFPQSERAPEASVLLTRIVTALGRKDLHVAIYYLKVGRRDAAAYYLRFVEGRYRDTQLGDVAFELLDAIESGQTRRQVMRSAKQLDRKLYEGRQRSENFEKDLEKLGL